MMTIRLVVTSLASQRRCFSSIPFCSNAILHDLAPASSSPICELPYEDSGFFGLASQDVASNNNVAASMTDVGPTRSFPIIGKQFSCVFK